MANIKFQKRDGKQFGRGYGKYRLLRALMSLLGTCGLKAWPALLFGFFCLLAAVRSSAQAPAPETNDLGAQFRNWLSQPGDFKRIIFSIPGSEFEFIRTKKTLEGPLYYEIGKQGKSFYVHNLTNLGSSWMKWPNPNQIVGVAANGDDWLIYQNNLNHQQTVAIEPPTNSPGSDNANGLARSTAANAEYTELRVGTLGFLSVAPGTFKWLNNRDFEAEVVSLASDATTKPRGTIKGTITDADNLGRPKRLAFTNSFNPPGIDSYMDYSYDNDLEPPWFPSQIVFTEKTKTETVTRNAVYIDLVELGTFADLPQGFTPARFLSVTNLADIAVVYLSNGLYYSSSRQGVTRIYRAEDPDRPQDPGRAKTWPHTLTRGIFYAVLISLPISLILILRRRRVR